MTTSEITVEVYELRAVAAELRAIAAEFRAIAAGYVVLQSEARGAERPSLISAPDIVTNHL